MDIQTIASRSGVDDSSESHVSGIEEKATLVVSGKELGSIVFISQYCMQGTS